MHIVVKNGHPKAGGPSCHRLTNPSEPDYTECRAMDVWAQQQQGTPRFPAPRTHKVGALDDPPGRRHHESPAQVCGCLCQSARGVADCDAAASALADIHVIDPDRVVAHNLEFWAGSVE